MCAEGSEISPRICQILPLSLALLAALSGCSEHPTEAIHRSRTDVAAQDSGLAVSKTSPPAAVADSPAASFMLDVTQDHSTLIISRAGDQAQRQVISSQLRVVGARPQISPLNWATEGAGVRAEVDAECGQYRIDVAPDPVFPRLVFTASVTYARDCVVSHESLSLAFRDVVNAEVLTRDMRSTAMETGRRYLTDRWTPMEVIAETPIGRVLIDRVAGFDSVVSTLHGGELEVRLEMDDAENHPFEPYAECVETYSPGIPRVDRSWSRHFVGERAVHTAEVWFGDKVPLRLRRLPEGRNGALVFTSHADQSRVDSTRALLWGHSDEANPLYGTQGFAPEGLGFTLCAWAQNGTFVDLDDAKFREMLSSLNPAKIEICAHSVTKSPDGREAVDLLSSAFAPFHTVTWIDHEPETNCEAINNSGASPADRTFFIRDILAKHGFRYVWVTPDQVPTGRVNQFEPQVTDSRAAFLYPLPRQQKDNSPLWAFRTVWRFLDRRVFFASYSDEALDKLTREDGIQIAHVYLDTWQPAGKFAERSLLETDRDGLRIRDSAAKLFVRLADWQRSRGLWVTSLRNLAGHLTGLASVRFEEKENGDVVVHGGDVDLVGVTITIPVGATHVTIDGAPPSGIRSSEKETTFWFDLPTSSKRTIRVTDEDRVHPLTSPGRIELRRPG